MDPNVQVAIATVIGTIVTTLGVVAVALIQSRKNDKKEEKTAEADDDTNELVKALLRENIGHERTIEEQKREIADLKAQLGHKEDT